MKISNPLCLCLLTSALVGFLVGFSPARAAQQLIPAPYPESFGSSAILPEGARPVSRHQHLNPDPVPQSLGPNALGNPESPRAHRHQHLRKTPYWRQYHRFPKE